MCFVCRDMEVEPAMRKWLGRGKGTPLLECPKGESPCMCYQNGY